MWIDPEGIMPNERSQRLIPYDFPLYMESKKTKQTKNQKWTYNYREQTGDCQGQGMSKMRQGDLEVQASSYRRNKSMRRKGVA